MDASQMRISIKKYRGVLKNMAERQENHVSIISWPGEPAKVEHNLKLEEVCPVSIHIDKQPLNVEIHSSADEQLNMNMDVNVGVKEAVPICIRLSEPICARSEYIIGIDIFDKPFAGVTFRGQTMLFNYQDEFSSQGRYGKTFSEK
jgi:hypothetical protein